MDGSSCAELDVCGAGQCSQGGCALDPPADCPLPVQPADGAAFGFAVAMDAELLVVGAPGSEGSASASVHVFTLGNDGYMEQTQAVPVAMPFGDSADANRRFGAAVDVDQGTIIVGEPQDVVPVGNAVSHGSASVFFRSNGAWDLQAKLVDDGGNCGEFGSAVAIDGDTVVVGAPGGDCAVVFQRSSGAWTVATRLAPASPGVRFGQSVDVSGDIAIVGAPGIIQAATCSPRGNAFVYSRGAEGWQLDSDVQDPSADGASCFGSAVALDGQTAAVGAPADDAAGTGAGAVYVIEPSDNVWQITASLLAAPAPPAEAFGSSVALDANVLLIGAPGAAGYLFERSLAAQASAANASPWTLLRTLLPPPGVDLESSLFAYSAALAPGHLALGAPGQQVAGVPGAGAVYPAVSVASAVAVCGDGTVTPPEQCDDGDTAWSQGQQCNAKCETVACADPNDSGSITAADALFTLRSAVGAASCDLAVCDASGNGTIAASDALLILKKAVGNPVALDCP
jgi:cysteine-rich repeat protein